MRNQISSDNFLKQTIKQIFTLLLLASVSVNAFHVQAQSKRVAGKTANAVKKPLANERMTGEVKISSSEQSNAALAKAWTTGELPAPLALPAGNADEVIAILAKKVAAKNAESIPALLTALQLSGFFITDKNGQVAFPPPDGKGQGLTVNGWEIASIAKMYGENRQTNLKDLNERLQSVAQFRGRDVGALMFEDVRRAAENTSNPFLRNWARFILELGVDSAGKTNQGTNAKPAEVEINAIQHFLLMRRLYGDLWARAERWRTQIRTANVQNPKAAQFVAASFSPASTAGIFGNDSGSTNFVAETTTFNAAASPDQSQVPCRMDGNAPTVMDAGATLTSELNTKLLDYLEEFYQDTPGEKALQKYKSFQTVANILLVYAKFIQSYAALDTRISAEDAEPLVRTRNKRAGARKKLRAEVRMNIGNWQMYNCIRLALSTTTGIDFSTLNDGPLGDVGVQWALTEGGDDYYSNSTGINRAGEPIVGFVADAPRRIQDKGVGAGPGTKGLRTANLTFTKTDEQGVAENILEGAPQKNEKNSMRVMEVKKQARVVTSIKLKAGEIKGDLVDVAGQSIGEIPALITMPAELLYRTSWAASGALDVPVIDWEECQKGWSGTISIKRKWSKDHTKILNPGEMSYAINASSVERFRTSFDYAGTINIENAPMRSIGGVNALNQAVNAVTIELKGEVTANAEYKSREDSKFINPESCGTRRTTINIEKVWEKATTGALEAQAVQGVMNINYSRNTYTISIGIPVLPATVKESGFKRAEGHCQPQNNSYNPIKSESSTSMDAQSIDIEDGMLDPKNPDVIEGSRSFKTKSGEEVEIRWSLRNCR